MSGINVKYNGTIELTDEVLDAIAERIANGTTAGTTAGKTGSGSSKKMTAGDFKAELAGITGDASRADIKKFLVDEFDFKSIAHVDIEAYSEVLDAAESYFSDGGGGDDEITVDSVKAKCQKLAKTKSGKDMQAEIFEDFEIKTAAGIKKLGDEDLEDLDVAINEALEDL